MARKAQPKRALIEDDTVSIGTGPLSFDVELARAHGWTDKSIERVYLEISKIVNRGSDAAARRRPELYRRHKDDDVDIFVGAIGNHSPDLMNVINDPDYLPITGRKSGKSDRRSRTDRRADLRRRGDKIAKKIGKDKAPAVPRRIK